MSSPGAPHVALRVPSETQALDYFNDHRNFDGEIEGQLGHSDRGACVLACVPENLNEAIRAAVDYFGLIYKAGRTVHHSTHFDDLPDGIKRADRLPQRLQEI